MAPIGPVRGGAPGCRALELSTWIVMNAPPSELGVMVNDSVQDQVPRDIAIPAAYLRLSGFGSQGVGLGVEGGGFLLVAHELGKGPDHVLAGEGGHLHLP